MLIVPSPDFLGSDPVNQSGKEAVVKAREQRLNDAARKVMQSFPDIADLSDPEARKGRELSHTEFVKRVLRITRGSIWAEPSVNWPGGMNFYRSDVDGKQECLYAAFEEGQLPEFSYFNKFDVSGKPALKKRGWREILTILIQRRVITKRQVEREFGAEPSSPQSIRWQMNTRNYA